MQFVQIFDYDGNPYLLKADEEGIPLQEELEMQGIENYTNIMPPSDLYLPRHFDGSKWHGASQEEWENNNDNLVPPIESPSDLELLKKTVQLLTLQINNIRKENVDLSEKLAELESKEEIISE